MLLLLLLERFNREPIDCGNAYCAYWTASLCHLSFLADAHCAQLMCTGGHLSSHPASTSKYDKRHICREMVYSRRLGQPQCSPVEACWQVRQCTCKVICCHKLPSVPASAVWQHPVSYTHSAPYLGFICGHHSGSCGWCIIEFMLVHDW